MNDALAACSTPDTAPTSAVSLSRRRGLAASLTRDFAFLSSLSQFFFLKGPQLRGPSYLGVAARNLGRGAARPFPITTDRS